MRNWFRKRTSTTGGQLVMFVLGMVVVTVLVPSVVVASTGTNVNISDRSSTTSSGNVKVRNNKLGVAVCDTGSGNLTSSNCSRVKDGRLQVGGLVAARPHSPSSPWVGECHGSSTSYYPSCSITVPAGKKLTIETVAFDGAIPDGQQLWWTTIQLTTGGVRQYYTMHLDHQGDYSGYRYFVKADNNVRFYADGGTTIYTSIGRSVPSGTASMSLRVSGFLT